MNRSLLTPQSDRLCILYNRDGHILHIHRVVSFYGSPSVTEDIETAARARAKAAGHDVTTLSALEIAGEQYDGSSLYHVDVARKQLVKTNETTPAA
jgi:hypothetical protein